MPARIPLAFPALLGVAALGIAAALATQSVSAAPQNDKISKDAVIQRVESFITSLGDTKSRADLIVKMCEGGPIQGLEPNQKAIGQLADSEITKRGLPMQGAESLALAQETNVSTFLCARTYVLRCEREPSVWHVLLYNSSKGWGVMEVGIAPNAHSLITTWRDFTVIPTNRQGQPAPASSGGR